jgi:hypothetical protein
MDKIDQAMVMAVLAAIAAARRDARPVGAERAATAWAIRMRGLKSAKPTGWAKAQFAAGAL